MVASKELDRLCGGLAVHTDGLPPQARQPDHACIVHRQLGMVARNLAPGDHNVAGLVPAGQPSLSLLVLGRRCLTLLVKTATVSECWCAAPAENHDGLGDGVLLRFDPLLVKEHELPIIL